MKYVVKNVSNRPIIIDNKTVQSNQKVITENYNELEPYIKKNMIICSNYKNHMTKNANKKDIIKNDLIMSNYKLYFNEELNDSDIDNIKYTYKNIFKLNDNLNNKLNNIKNKNDLLLLLINEIYPYLLNL